MADRLYRSRSDRVISGVAGGLAERLELDPSLVRVVWVVLAVVSSGLFALVYLVMMVVVPEAPFDQTIRGGTGEDPWSSPAATGVRATPRSDAEAGTPSTPPAATGIADTGTEDTARFATGETPGQRASWLGPDGRRVEAGAQPAWQPPKHRNDPGAGVVLGVILILIGAFFLLRQYAPEVDLGMTWPLLSVGAGVVLLVLALVPGRSRT